MEIKYGNKIELVNFLSLLILIFKKIKDKTGFKSHYRTRLFKVFNKSSLK